MSGAPSHSELHSRRWTHGVLWGLAFVALILRLWNLSGPSLWVDEVITVNTARQFPDIGWSGTLIKNNTFPLYFYGIYWVQLLFGTTEWTMRLPSVLAGALTVPFLGYWVQSITHRATSGWVAALLLAFNPLHLWFSQEARPYALVLCLGCAALWAYGSLKRPSTPGRLIAFVVLSILATAHHIIGAVFVLTLSIALLLHRGWRALQLSERLALTLSLTYVVAQSALMAWLPRVYSVDRPSSVLELPYTLLTFVGGFSLGPSVRDIQTLGASSALAQAPIQSACAVAMVGLTGVLALRVMRSHMTFAILACLPIALVFLVAFFTPFAFNVRYTLPALLGCAALLSVVPLHRRNGANLTALVSLFLLADIQWFQDPAYGKEDTRAAIKALKQARPNGASTVAVPQPFAKTWLYYAQALELKGEMVRYRPEHEALQGCPDALVVARTHQMPFMDAIQRSYQAHCGGTVLLDNASGLTLFIASAETDHVSQ